MDHDKLNCKYDDLCQKHDELDKVRVSKEDLVLKLKS